MNRTFANIIIDLVAALLFLGMIATGYLLRFPLPPGSNKTHSLWGFTRHQWGDIHFWISLGLLVVLVIHLVLHWNWIVTVIGKRCFRTTAAHPSLIRSGVISFCTVMLIFTLFAWAAQNSVETTDRPMRRARSQDGQVNEQTIAPPVQAGGDQSKLVFQSEVYPIFEKNCLACHGPQKQFAGFRVDRPEDFFSSKGSQPLVFPGQSAASPLMAIVTGARKDIPFADRHTLSQQELSIIKTWIDAGAKWPEKSGSGK
jgi:hypothetical protein